MLRRNRFLFLCPCVVCLGGILAGPVGWGEDVPDSLRASVEQAAALVKPALVQIHVVSTRYAQGRELKTESVGSGVIITKEGHVVTNHHVAGHAKRLMCTLSNKEEVEAELVGTDPLTDIAVIKLNPVEPREFPVAEFGDSDALYVGQYVLAMGCPMALSHSVTLGIVSNTEMIMPEFYGEWGLIKLDGENVGALVRWVAHDAEIYGGNSGGPLVDLEGRVVGINEIRMGLGGAIPGNLAQAITEVIIAEGQVQRSWFGFDVQPLLKRDKDRPGVLVSGTIEGAPAAKAGLESGDLLIRVGDQDITVRFAEELPAFNRLVADLPVAQPVQFVVLREGNEVALTVTPIEREAVRPKQHELKQWGITARNLSLMDAKELKRDTKDGVLVTSVRPGGPAGEAKPAINSRDIVVNVDGKPVKNLAQLRALTVELTEGKTEPTPVLTGFERKTGKYVTVVRVGIRELPDPALEVKKAWLSAETQVLTRDIAEVLDRPDLTGFRVTRVYPGKTAEAAGLEVGDIITALDGEKLTASAPEHYDELPTLIRQYKVGSSAELSVLRGDDDLTIPVELIRAPKANREMKKHRNEQFEFTVRNVSFFDKAREKWDEDQHGVLVDEVKPGGWAALGGLNVGDLVLEVEGAALEDVDAFEKVMGEVVSAKPDLVVLQVLRGIHTIYIEFEPKWEEDNEQQQPPNENVT